MIFLQNFETQTSSTHLKALVLIAADLSVDLFIVGAVGLHWILHLDHRVHDEEVLMVESLSIIWKIHAFG